MKIVVVGVLADSMVSFRGQMLRAMAEAGHEVLALAPEESDTVRAALAEMGVTYRAAPIRRTGLNPLRDAITVVSLVRTFRWFGADCVMVYAAKPVIYGSIAARLARVPRRAAMITGVGSALGGSAGKRRRVLSRLVRLLYAVAMRGVHVVFFQNPDDLRLFRSLDLVGPRNRVVMINGSGVDLSEYAPARLPSGPTTFLMIGRLIRDKGVHEYVDAARRVRALCPEVRFHLLGPLDTNPTAVTATQLETWKSEGVVDYLGETMDVRPYIAAAHICVLPSYGEGMPRSILEAMAMARPVLVTDVPGCRETVVDGLNGRMVPVRDAESLANAMLEMNEDRHRLEEMGRHSRAIAEERFDVRSVNGVILSALGVAQIPESVPGPSQ